MNSIFDLQLFADEGAAGEAAVAAESQVATGTGGGVETAPDAVPPAQGDRQSYEEIRKLYGGDIDKEIRNAVEKRLKREKGSSDKLKKLQPLIDRTAKKYGKDSKDLDALMDAFNADKSYYDELAMKNGTTPEIEEQLELSAREARSAREALAEREEQDRIREQTEKIARQVDEVKQFFPDFDLKTEMESSEQFRKLASNPYISLLDAYKATHFDAEINKAMKMTAQTVEANVVNNIKSGNMTRENGIGNASPAAVSADYSKYTAKDFRDMADRARRGEIIKF